MVSHSPFLSHPNPRLTPVVLVGLVLLLGDSFGSTAPSSAQGLPQGFSQGFSQTLPQTLPPASPALPAAPSGLTFGQPLPTTSVTAPVSVPLLPPGAGELPFQVPPAPPLSTALGSPVQTVLPFGAGPRYLVYVRGSSDLLLEQVQRLEPGAFRQDIDNQRVIQAGIFSTEANAEDLVRQLNAQGILAEVETVTEPVAGVGSGPSFGGGPVPGAVASAVSNGVGAVPFAGGLGSAPVLPALPGGNFGAGNFGGGNFGAAPSVPFTGTASTFNPAGGLGAFPAAAFPATLPTTFPTALPTAALPGGIASGAAGTLPPFPGAVRGVADSNTVSFGTLPALGAGLPLGSAPFAGNAAPGVGAVPFGPGGMAPGVGVKSYYIAIPASPNSLNEIYQTLMQANLGVMPPLEQRMSRLGSFLAIGPFGDRVAATLAETQLQAAGLHNARVYYGY
ncbi:MAG: SPOR domain-containing protein [Prochlorothrix sp.]